MRRAELIRNYTNDFYLSTHITTTFMDIDHGRFVYSDEFLGTEDELALIHLLDYFNNVGHNVRRGVVTLDDLVPTTVGYAALRTWEDPEVRKYLGQITVWDEDRYVPGSAYRYFEELAVDIALLCGRMTCQERMERLKLSKRATTAQRARLRFPKVWLALCNVRSHIVGIRPGVEQTRPPDTTRSTSRPFTRWTRRR